MGGCVGCRGGPAGPDIHDLCVADIKADAVITPNPELVLSDSATMGGIKLGQPAHSKDISRHTFRRRTTTPVEIQARVCASQYKPVKISTCKVLTGEPRYVLYGSAGIIVRVRQAGAGQVLL